MKERLLGDGFIVGGDLETCVALEYNLGPVLWTAAMLAGELSLLGVCRTLGAAGRLPRRDLCALRAPLSPPCSLS